MSMFNGHKSWLFAFNSFIIRFVRIIESKSNQAEFRTPNMCFYTLSIISTDGAIVVVLCWCFVLYLSNEQGAAFLTFDMFGIWAFMQLIGFCSRTRKKLNEEKKFHLSRPTRIRHSKGGFVDYPQDLFTIYSSRHCCEFKYYSWLTFCLVELQRRISIVWIQQKHEMISIAAA